MLDHISRVGDAVKRTLKGARSSSKSSSSRAGSLEGTTGGPPTPSSRKPSISARRHLSAPEPLLAATSSSPLDSASPGPRTPGVPGSAQHSPSSFPDMASLPLETVTKRWYSWNEKVWTTCPVRAKIMPVHFASGSVRLAHHMLVVRPDGVTQCCVAKCNKKVTDRTAEAYDSGVIMQAACQAVAAAFNAYQPPKKINFLDSYVIQRADGSWWAVETFLAGKYVKHNNNFGYVRKGARNTPQAFSHFSYEFSGRKMMIVDMQGVGDFYTDPQIHTVDGAGFGVGNQGRKGMQQFLATHNCNPICQCLGLKFIGPTSPDPAGSTPGATVMARQALPVQPMLFSEFIGNLQPIKGSATNEDLSLLGLKARQMDSLVDAFNRFDKDASGYLDRNELYDLYHKLEVPGVSNQDEEFQDFVARLNSCVCREGKVSFRAFVLCWTDTQ